MNWESYKETIKESGGLEENWYILGIDLGTTNSVISYWSPKTGRPEAIDVSNGFGKIPMPSVVQYREEEEAHEWVIGEEALETMKIFPETTVRSIKRKMGTRETVTLGGEAYLPEELSAMMLRQLIGQVAAMNPKMSLAGVVVSVPYDFSDRAKKATIKACHLAGLSDSLICLIEEPKAAALAYNFRHDLALNEKVMVFDFGGGTLDITHFHVEKKDETAIHLKVISEGGEAYHGGDNVDDILYQQLLTWLEAKNGMTRDSLTKEAVAELSGKATEAKERLSGVTKHRIPFTFCIPPFVQPVTRDELEGMIQPFILRTKQLVEESLANAYDGAIKPSDVTRILLEGGSARMPWVKGMLAEIFGDEDKIYVSEQPALDISLGACYYAAMKLGVLAHQDIQTTDRAVSFETPVPHDIGFEVAYGDGYRFYPMIRRGTPYPLARRSMVFTVKSEGEDDRDTLRMRILERLKEEDAVAQCKLIEDVALEGVAAMTEERGQVTVTLSIDERSGTATGQVTSTGGETIWHF